MFTLKFSLAPSIIDKGRIGERHQSRTFVQRFRVLFQGVHQSPVKLSFPIQTIEPLGEVQQL